MAKKSKKDQFSRYNDEDEHEVTQSIRTDGRKISDYDIKIAMSVSEFESTFGFMEGINDECVINFKKDGMSLYTCHPSTSYGCVIKINPIGLIEYDVQEEKDVLMDLSFIKLNVLKETHAVYFYINGNQFYLTNDRLKMKRSILSMLNDNRVLRAKKSFFEAIDEAKKFQKVSIDPDTPLKPVIASLDKRKGEDKMMWLAIQDKNIKFALKDNEEEFDIVIQGTNAIEGKIANSYSVESFLSFKVAKLINIVDMYVQQDSNLLLEVPIDRFGYMNLEYIMMPREETSSYDEEDEKQEQESEVEKPVEDELEPVEDVPLEEVEVEQSDDRC